MSNQGDVQPLYEFEDNMGYSRVEEMLVKWIQSTEIQIKNFQACFHDEDHEDVEPATFHEKLWEPVGTVVKCFELPSDNRYPKMEEGKKCKEIKLRNGKELANPHKNHEPKIMK